MRLTNLVKKISFIFTILVCTLIVFCFPIKIVKADNLSSLEIINYENKMTPSFDSDVYDYSIKIPSNEIDLYFKYEKVTQSDNVIITGNRYLKKSTGTITIKVGSNKTYNINYSREDLDASYDYSCTKNVQYFYPPVGGRYVLETWGAQGAGYDLPGNSYASYGGKGGYSKGIITLKRSDVLHVYVGCVGSFSSNGLAQGGYNGGGAAYTVETKDPANGGGGASDIRVNSDSLYSRVIVAGGGGGGSEDYPNSSYSSETSGGAGGGENGTGNTNGNNYGGTQTSASGGATFGYGANTPNDGGGGGGGWYGGGTINGSQSLPGGNNNADTNGGSGGSGFVLNSTTISNVPSGYLLGEKYFLTNSITIDGEKQFLSPEGTTVTGNSGDGFVRITPYENDFTLDKDNYLLSITPSVGTLSPTFDKLEQEYTITTGVYDQYISFDVEKSSNNAVAVFDESYLLETGVNTINITVTSELGDIRIYKINVVRPIFPQNTHSTKIKKITYFDGKEIYPLENQNSYNITVPSYKSKLSVVPELYDSDANYKIEGNELLDENGGQITITVTDDYATTSIYTLNYTKYYVSKTNDFTCTNSTQVYQVPVAGDYVLEVWGSQGSGSNSSSISGVGVGGKGGYSKGTISLEYNEKLYVEVGCYGTVSITGRAEGGYNGGGAAFSDLSSDPAAGGGGATDIRIGNDSIYSRVIVAGGGGGGSEDASETAGAGGGLEGTGNSKGNSYPGTQTSSSGGGVFGYGASTAYDGGGGGGGWYGGGTIGGYQGIPTSNTDADTNGGSGGSGFIFTSETSASTPEGYLLDSKYYLADAETIGGTANMPSPTSDDVTTGHSGEGYARITFLQPLSEDNFLKTLTSDVGLWNKTFDPLTEEYVITVDMYTQKINISGEANSELASVVGLGEYNLDIGENNIDISVIAEDGTTKIYNLKVTRSDLNNSHTAEINKILIDGYEDVLIERNVLEYNISILPSEAHLNITIVPYDSEETYVVTGNDILNEDEGTITIVSSEPHSQDITYIINYSKEILDYGSEYTCINDVQTYTAPATGTYKLQVWGAQGGYRSYASNGGKGGYSEGTIELQEGETLYVYVGGSGNTGGTTGGFNGGGSRASYNGGGGATDIRVEGDSLYNRIIVAGGGGSDGAYNKPGKAGGGTEGISATESYGSGGSGGTQTYAGDGGDFGQGGYGSYDNGGYGGAGGGGWYGGGGSTPDGSGDDDRGGGGGSGFVYTNTGSTPVDGYLVQNHVLTEAKTVDGTNENIPTYDGTSTMTGNSGNGYAKINITDVLSKDFYLLSLMTDKGEWNKSFEPLTNEYNITLGVDDTQLTVSGRPSSDLATIEGLGDYDIPAGITEIPITVTAESGDERVYTIKVSRPASTEDRVRNITITGLVQEVCLEYPGYCQLDNEFDPDIHEYYMTVPSGIRELEFTVDKMHDYQTIVGDGVSKLKVEENTVTIEVTSEDGENRSTYTYYITRDLTGDNYLDTLKVKPIDENNEIGEEIDIGFHHLIEEYSFKVENDIHKLDLEIVPDDERALVSVIGNENFSVGNNIVDIEVKASNNEIRTYRLNVYRVSNDNPLLESIEVRDTNNNSYQLSPEFNDVKTKYTVTVDNEITSVNIIATPQKNTTTVEGDGLKTLNTGRNTYTIVSTAENGLTFTYEVVVIRLQNSNSYLSSLSASEGSFNEVFDKEEPNYTITVDAHIKALTIEATPEVNTSTVNIIGNSNFVIGENEVIVRVTAEDGSTRDYTITVTKLGSDNNYLSTLSVKNGEIELLTGYDKETPSYEIHVGNEVTKVKVTGTLEDNLSRVEGLREYNLSTGNNEIKVKVTSETGIERIYTINIIRDKNNDATLRAINLTSGSINLEAGVYEYTLEVENDIENITVTGVPTVSTTSVSGNGRYELEVGIEREITLTTLAEDEVSSLTYKVKVTRKKNDNAYLRALSIAEGNLRGTFIKTTNNYTLTVRNNITSVTVQALPEVETSSVVISKPESLVEGENEVRVTVTSESGEVNIYYVTVTRLSEEASKLNLSTLDVRGCEITFDPDTYDYSCEVSYELSDTDITATPVREEYIVSGTGAKVLEVGENTFVVKVEDEKKTDYNEYTIRITRKESTETRLKNIRVVNHTLNEIYDKDNPNYTLNTEENYIFVTYEKMHEDQEVTISGNNSLTIGSNIVTIHVVSADRNYSQDYTITVNKSPNTNNYLQSLGVSGYTISPGFTKGRMEYTLTVENEVDSVTVNATPEEATSSVSGTGMHSLVKGKNIINVVVTSESGTPRTYTIEVTKLGSRNAKLLSLSVTGQTISPEFNKDTTSYTLVVPYEVSSVEINAVPEDVNALISGDGEVSLNQGVNDKAIIVTSENGDTLTYWIHITRNNPVTSKLKNIKVRNYKLSPAFESNTTSYTVIVDNEVESLDLIIEKLDPNSTYVIEGNELEVGENEVKVISTSSDGGETTEYIITVVRQAYSNTYLSSLTVNHGELEPTFDKTILNYEVEVGYEVEEIDIEGIAEDLGATVEGNGIKNLSIGRNEYEIRVSKSGITRRYYVTVIRKGSSDVGILSITSNLGEVEKIDEGIYRLVVPYNTSEILSSNITVVPENNRSIVSKQGRLDLSISQTYNIRVTSEDGENQRDYVINIILDKSTNNYLSSLVPSVGTLSPSFIKTTEDYTIEVLDTTTEIEFTAILEDSRAEILNDSLVFDLPNYSNTIEIKVKSEKGAIRTYNITVTKSLTRERTLSNIEITGLEEIETDYEFGETTYLYNLIVPYDITSVGFNVTKKHPSQIVEIIEDSSVVNSCTLSVGINVCDVKVTNSYNEELTYRYNIERLKNTNNYLRSLRLTSPEIELENFDRERQEYNVTVPYNYENIGVEGVPEDTENARVTISGTTYLIEGIDNDVKVRVRAQNGSVREYIIHVLRLPESNNLLKTLTVSSGEIYILSPKFTPGTTEYTLEVPSPVDLVSVEGLALDDNATVIGNGDYNLRVGLNKIEIKVISEDLEERTYKVNITRLADKNVYLSKLVVNNGTLSPTFEKTRGVYRVDLPYTESALSLDIATEDPGATYEVIGNSNLKYGENEVRIKVVSSDGSASKTYVLTVVKQGNINNNLSDLKVDGETISGFDPEITSYTYVVEYAKDNVLIEATPEDSTSTVVGEGYKSLVEGSNTINVDVISQSGLIKTYQVTVTRKLNTNLMAIVTDRGEVTPTFDKETLSYTLEVENNIKDITVIGVKESSNAEVTGNGKYELNVGENEINLEVTNGIYSRTYKLIVIRKGSSNTNLKYLTVAESILDKEYSNEENEYTLYIQDDIRKLSLSYEPEDETTIVEEIGNENFDEENEEVKLKITSTDGSERIVTIHVIRESESTFSNKLLNLSVNKGTMSPRYTEEVQEYTVTVPSNTKEITISATKRGEQKVEGIGTKAITKQREEFKVSVTSKDGKVRVYTLIVYKQAGTDARLSELEFNEGYLTPGFNKNVYNYVLTAESDTRIVTTKSIKTVDENASYEIYGTLLSENNKQIRIEVTAQDGETKKNYIIDVVQEKSNNANLASLTSNIGILNPTFNKNTQSYTIEVENEVSDIIIDAVPENSKATVTGDGKHNLRTGSNTINILVTAETGTVRTYTIIVNRALSSNVDLKDLYVRGYTMSPTFDKDEISYTLEVENDVTYVDIDGELADSLSSVIGLGRRDLTVGLNACDVIVTAENGNIKTYTINITRKDKLSSKIENLVVKEGTLSPTFGKEQLEYTISIPNEYRKITPIITLEDPNATYRILGNANLEVGNNVVTIEVTSSDNKETTTYTLNVIRNISSNNYLSTLKVSEGTLTPEFDKTVGYYEVEVENDIDRITVTGTPEATTTFIAGFGSYDLEVGENMILIRTMSENGIPRSYQIKVTRKANDSNYLSDLRALEGSLNPVFDKEHGAYEVVVEEGTKEVHIEGAAEEETSEVTGLGTHTIKAGTNTINVLVTSESGKIRTYTLIVVRPLSSNTNVTTFTPDTGVLSPTFTNDNDDYVLNVGKNINVVNIEVEPESSEAKVGGNKNITISGNSKEATISVLAEDGTLREIKVTINRESSIEDITVNNKNILIVKGEEVELDITTTPIDANPTYTYEIENNIIDIEGKTIKGLVEGTTKVTVKVEENNLISKEVQVTVTSDKIKSNIYEVKDKEDRIVIGAEEGTTIEEFKDNLLNDKRVINIYDKEGNVVADTDIVRTGLTIKLENNSVTYDEAILIVRGDIDGDGIIDVTDESILTDHVLESKLITGNGIYAADIEEDGIIDVTDDSTLTDYILKIIDSLN